MNESEGIVVRLEGDYAWVEAKGEASACGACAQRSGCASAGQAASLLDGLKPSAPGNRLLRLRNTIRARPGDAVMIESAEGMVLRAAWLAYGIPLLLGIAGAVLASMLTGSEPVAFGGLLLGLASGILVMRWWRLEGRRTEPIFSMRFKNPSHFIVRGPESC